MEKDLQMSKPEGYQQRKEKLPTEQSELREHYSQLISPIQVDHIQIKQQLQRKGIKYDHLNSTQDFFFQVEKIVPSFDFYRLYVSISHFKLTLNVAKYFHQNVFKSVSNENGNYGQIYFAQLEKQELCFKSFAFNQEEVFQKVFVRAVHQLSILKICSALECAPYIKNYLGFDMIIYDDCIQFAFEKGSPLQRIDSDQILSLKQHLRLMHQLKIVHCDIKPQNIIFSHHFNKAVFIDFGFSQIVKECLGYKTMSKFKGTPNYCSPQMLAIILDKQELIDLYYNDAFSLQETCKHFNYKNILSQQQYCFSKLSKLQKQSYLEYVQRDKLQNIFLMFAFQQHYSCENQVKAHYLFKRLINNDDHSLKQILNFIKKGINYIFNPNFFKQKLALFKSRAEYAEIRQIMQANRQLLLFQEQKQVQDNQRKFDLRQITLSFSQFVDSQDNSVEYYYKALLKITYIQNSLLCHQIAMIFKCVRFDEKNLSLNRKVQIASKFNPLLTEYFANQQAEFIKRSSIMEQNQEMRQIKLLVRLIFHYCLSQKLQKWIKKHVFDVFQQIILLNDNSYQFATLLFQFLSKHGSQFQSIEVMLELKRLMQSTWLLQSAIIDKQAQLKRIFQENISNRIEKFKEQSRSSTDPETLSICALFQDLNVCKVLTQDLTFIEEEHHLNNIKNPNIRKYLQHWIMGNKIATFNTIFLPTQMSKIAESLKKSIGLHNIDFLSRAKLFQQVLITCNIDSLRKFYAYIASVINCPHICSYLKLQAQLHNKWSEEKSLGIIDKLIQRLPYLYQKKIIQQVCNFIYHEAKTKSKQYIEKVILLYKVYERINYRVSSQNCQEAQKFIDVYDQAQVQVYFYQLSPLTQQAFLKSLGQYQNQLQEFMKSQLDKIILKAQFYFVKMKALIFRFHYLLLHDQKQSLSLCFQSIISICEELKLNFLMLSIIKLGCDLGVFWRSPQLIIKSTRCFFNFCSINSDYSIYLLPTNQSIFRTTLHVFARENKQAFHCLLLRLALFLSQNPFHATKDYLINLLRSIDNFIKKDTSLCHLIHYKLFIGSDLIYNLRFNPYLLIFYVYSIFNQESKQQLKLLVIFAKNCQLLSNFARKRLLEKYFIVFLSVIGQKSKRKKKFVYRQAKNYIKGKIKLKQSKQCFKITKKSRFYSKRKEKIKNFLKKMNQV